MQGKIRIQYLIWKASNPGPDKNCLDPRALAKRLSMPGIETVCNKYFMEICAVQKW
jgi:hypothetical protein